MLSLINVLSFRITADQYRTVDEGRCYFPSLWTENSPVCHFCPSLWTDNCRLFSVHRISLFLLLFAYKRPSPFFYICPTKNPRLTHKLSILHLNQAMFNLPGSAIIRPTRKPSPPPAIIPFINSEKNTVGVNNVCKILGFSRVRVRVNVSVRVILVCIMISLGDSIW